MKPLGFDVIVRIKFEAVSRHNKSRYDWYLAKIEKNTNKTVHGGPPIHSCIVWEVGATKKLLSKYTRYHKEHTHPKHDFL